MVNSSPNNWHFNKIAMRKMEKKIIPKNKGIKIPKLSRKRKNPKGFLGEIS